LLDLMGNGSIGRQRVDRLQDGGGLALGSLGPQSSRLVTSGIRRVIPSMFARWAAPGGRQIGRTASMSAPASPLAAWESAGGVIRKCRRCPRLCSRYSGAGAHLWIEFQRDRVHAIAVAGRLGAVREHVPEGAAAA